MTRPSPPKPKYRWILPRLTGGRRALAADSAWRREVSECVCVRYRACGAISAAYGYWAVTSGPEVCRTSAGAGYCTPWGRHDSNNGRFPVVAISWNKAPLVSPSKRAFAPENLGLHPLYTVDLGSGLRLGPAQGRCAAVQAALSIETAGAAKAGAAKAGVSPSQKSAHARSSAARSAAVNDGRKPRKSAAVTLTETAIHAFRLWRGQGRTKCGAADP